MSNFNLIGANLNDMSSIFWIGYCYATGEGGAPNNKTNGDKALKYLKKAAELGHGKIFIIPSKSEF